MSLLSSRARWRSLQLRLNYIEEKIVGVQEELLTLEQEITEKEPRLFVHEHLGVTALKRQLEHLERVAAQIREELRNV